MIAVPWVFGVTWVRVVFLGHAVFWGVNSAWKRPQPLLGWILGHMQTLRHVLLN